MDTSRCGRDDDDAGIARGARRFDARRRARFDARSRREGRRRRAARVNRDDRLTPRRTLDRSIGSEPRRLVRPRLRHHGGFLVQRGEQEQGRHMEREHPVRLPVEPEEVHSGHEDGLRRSEEAGRPRGFDRVPEGEHQVGVRPRVRAARASRRASLARPASFVASHRARNIF